METTNDLPEEFMEMNSSTLNGRDGKRKILLRAARKLVYKRKRKMLLNGEESHLGARYSLVIKKKLIFYKNPRQRKSALSQ